MGNVFVEATDVKIGRFIDTRFNLQDKEWGREQYQLEHIDGSIYWDLEKDLSDLSSTEGRHPMPSKLQLQQLFQQSGLTYEDTIYVYDQGGAPFAARAWWMLKYANFPKVYIVNGGFTALKEAGFTVSSEEPTFQSSTLTVEWNDAIYVNRQHVKNIVDGVIHAKLLDARAAIRYRGEHETIDKVAGHIPTAINFDWEQLKEGASLHFNDELLNVVDKSDDVVVYCGSGVTASPLYAILADAGYKNLKLYVGSFSDWINHYEVETGDNK
ncbi:thiosulfate/3-mercaptopyruvate sulfurtransferase [Ureibacillus xyleni]|uniref:Thiosulfate/3-mercaptopyruvate sulfurtransferase n=1 Tax=Ureibacillus xyleni TaxID=614648 RepID=A0A285TC11_9BACL|nr:rhodanese-like domain-containing protein [Ureibacillus xyleni]SOC19680.1 thiosulfate/3-mercaptopyruvate sulfurtransferase [Ureibacillus xyleni]